jgi:hypothetical protein
MTLKSLFACVIATSSIILPKYGHTAFHYTYTSGPLTYLESTVTIGNPPRWSFDVSQVFTYAPEDNSALFFLSSLEGNIFSITAIRPFLEYHTIVAASGGAWTRNEVSSPVPENGIYALLLRGLGLVGYRVRSKRKDSSYLRKSPRSKYNYTIHSKRA